MKTFKQFINESKFSHVTVEGNLYILSEKTINELKKLKKDCSSYINSYIDNGDSVIYRGTRKKLESPLSKFSVRKDRTPSDVPLITHEILDEAFDKLVGIKARSKTLFGAQTIAMAEDYGNPYIIFPIGEVDIVTSNEVDDLYSALKENRLVLDKKKLKTRVNELISTGLNDKEHIKFLLSRISLNKLIEAYEDMLEDLDDLDISEEDVNEFIVNCTADVLKDNGYFRTDALKNISTDSELMINCDSYYLLNDLYILETDENDYIGFLSEIDSIAYDTDSNVVEYEIDNTLLLNLLKEL